MPSSTVGRPICSIVLAQVPVPVSAEVMCLESGMVTSPAWIEPRERSHHRDHPLGVRREGERSFRVPVKDYSQSANL